VTPRYDASLAAGGALTGVRDVLVVLQDVGIALAPITFVLVGRSIAFAFLFASIAIHVVLRASAAIARAVGWKTPVKLHVEGEALVVEPRAGRTRAIALSQIDSAQVLPTSARLVLHGPWGQRNVFHFGTALAARSVLRELKLSALERPATFSFFFGLRVTVGADGVLMAWPLIGRRRFIPYSKVVSMTPSPGAILFRLADGDRYEIMTTTSSRSVVLEQHEALVERIEDAVSAYHAANAEPPLEALRRGGRSALGWIKDLRALSETSGAGYRAATLPSEALWDLALDAAAVEELRIGAGLALRHGLDEEGRTKLRAAAAASASPPVRVALEASAEENIDDEQLRARIFRES